MTNIADIRRPIEEEFRLFEKEFERALLTKNPLLKEVLSLVLARRGKQLRPTLVLLSAKLCHGVNDKTIQAAVALELLHTASLMHDDVVDGSDLRRGLPSVNARWNNKIAVLTGDYMLSKVIEILATLRNVKILGIVSEMGKSLSEGELLQLHTKDDMWISERDYFNIIDKKTARLFAACCEAGAVSSGASMKQETALSCFGEELGICFQMQDDILDYSDSEELGKPTMGDIRDGKVTLPLLIALNRAPKAEAQHIISLTQHDINFNIENEIKSFVLRYDGIRYAQQRMREHQQTALSALSSFRACPATEALALLLNHTVNRVF
ncbi:MAG: polyprenyl synthetase family protein [Paludibacteraceae bacterium]|nr:polyprenyl synthetase family protein [Paludibacteraceae bacterium]